MLYTAKDWGGISYSFFIFTTLEYIKPHTYNTNVSGSSHASVSKRENHYCLVEERRFNVGGKNLANEKISKRQECFISSYRCLENVFMLQSMYTYISFSFPAFNFSENWLHFNKAKCYLQRATIVPGLAAHSMVFIHISIFIFSGWALPLIAW